MPAYHVCIQAQPISEAGVFFPLHFIPSSTVRLCWESAESISVGLTGSEGLSYVGGACELLQQQREHFVSSNSWEATAEDKDC